MFFLRRETALCKFRKALEAGSGVDAAKFTGGRALQPEGMKKCPRCKKKPCKCKQHFSRLRKELGLDLDE